MLSKEEKRSLNQQFWEGFKQYMRKKMSSNGKRINWVNYPSDVKDIYIRWEVDGKGVRLCLDVQPKDESVREILWEQLGELKTVLFGKMEEQGDWNEHYKIENGRTISRISWQNNNLNYYSVEDHPKIYSYMEDHIRSFDNFYQEYKEILISLAE